MKKSCTRCKKKLDIYKFYATKRLRLDGTTIYQSWCKVCSKEQANKSSKKHRPYNPIRNMFSGAQQRAKNRNLEFNITRDYLQEIYPKDNKCPLLGIILESCKSVRARPSPSLDRIDPTKGYIKGNVQIISWQANTMKNNASLKELQLFCINTLKYLNEKIYKDKVSFNS